MHHEDAGAHKMRRIGRAAMRAGALIAVVGGLLGHIAYKDMCENNCSAIWPEQAGPILVLAAPGILTLIIGALVWLTHRP